MAKSLVQWTNLLVVLLLCRRFEVFLMAGIEKPGTIMACDVADRIVVLFPPASTCAWLSPGRWQRWSRECHQNPKTALS